MSNEKMKRTANTFGERLINARKSMGYTQKKFAELLGIAPQTLNKYEKNIRTPDITIFNAMVRLAQCDAEWLLSGKERDIPRDIHESWGPVADILYEIEGLLINRSLKEDQAERLWSLIRTFNEQFALTADLIDKSLRPIPRMEEPVKAIAKDKMQPQLYAQDYLDPKLSSIISRAEWAYTYGNQDERQALQILLDGLVTSIKNRRNASRQQNDS